MGEKVTPRPITVTRSIGDRGMMFSRSWASFNKGMSLRILNCEQVVHTSSSANIWLSQTSYKGLIGYVTLAAIDRAYNNDRG